MIAGPRTTPPDRLAWLHCGRYILIAIALHAAILLYPLSLAVDTSEALPTRAIMLNLHETVTTPKIKQPAPPEKPPAQQQPRPDKSLQFPRPILAIAPEQNTPNAVTVTVPVVTQPTLQTAPTPANVAAQAVYSAPAFNVTYLQNPEPKYPPISRRLGEEGKVLLKVRVTPDGRAVAVSVEKGSSFERLDEAAREAVTHWRFVPAKRGDEAIEAMVIVPIVFRLDN
jgi:protein TonB